MPVGTAGAGVSLETGEAGVLSGTMVGVKMTTVGVGALPVGI